MSDSNKDDKPLNDFNWPRHATHAKAYKRFDQLSLAELEALVERLQAIIASMKQAGASREKS